MRVTRNLRKIARANQGLGTKLRAQVNESSDDFEQLLENRLNAYWNDARPAHYHGRAVDEVRRTPSQPKIRRAPY